MNHPNNRAYVLVEIQSGKEKEFSEEILAKGLILDSKVERMDFVHGSCDFIMLLHGTMKDIDRRILDMRNSPFVCKTKTLISFEVFTWEDLANVVREQG